MHRKETQNFFERLEEPYRAIQQEFALADKLFERKTDGRVGEGEGDFGCASQCEYNFSLGKQVYIKN